MKMTRAILAALTVLACAGLHPHLYGQQTDPMPQWWFGAGLAPNFNFYSSTVQQLNPTTRSVGAFMKGSGTGLFLAPMLEFRPDPVWGGILALGYDGRGGSFDDLSVNDKTASLTTSANYISLEPSLRFSPFPFGLYFYAGPRLGFNVGKSFTYTYNDTATTGDWSGTRGSVLGGQLGAGWDIRLTPAESEWQVDLSPFLSAQFGQGPRSEEKWSLASVRAGVALLFGNSSEGKSRIAGEVQFTIRAPKIIPVERKVKETFPMRNYVFFDMGSDVLPERYIRLTKEQAAAFREEQLLQPEPKDLTGRSRRQMTVYHDVLNIIGDRMRRMPSATITLLGASEQGPSDGQTLADAVKNYLVNIFGIDGVRIRTEGHSKPPIPSAEPGGTRELDLVRPEDRRVDITSSDLAILDPVQIISLQEDPLDSDVLFNVGGAPDLISSWSLTATDENGGTKRFGPFVTEEERISGREILGEKVQGQYTVELDAQTKDGQEIKKTQSMHLVRSQEPEEAPGYRFSILFEFDQSKTVATYEHFLTSTVAPLITDGSSVIIHGHTDIVGEESHNLKLSQDRAKETMNVLERALSREGRKNVRFDTYGFGADVRRAPFDNKLPEERFYNRTVIIDIVPE